MDLSSPYPEKEATPGPRGYVCSKGGWEIPFSIPYFPSPCRLPALSIPELSWHQAQVLW